MEKRFGIINKIPKKMKLYLLRHAERGHGEKQDTLTDLGIKQSEKIVPFLKN